MKKAIIQINNYDRFPNREDDFSAYIGFSNLGIECVFLTLEQIVILKDFKELGFNYKEIVGCSGSINFTKIVTRLCNKKYYIQDSYPEQLKKYLNRDIYEITLSELLNKINNESQKLPIFIKPKNLKTFFTKTLTSKKDVSLFLFENNWNIGLENNFPKDEICLISEVKNIKSEWRNYVHKNKLIDSKCYQGDFKITPKYNIIERMINDYSEKAPVSYSLDIFIEDVYESTNLLECNSSAISLGNYGLDSSLYAEMIIDSFNELKTYL